MIAPSPTHLPFSISSKLDSEIIDQASVPVCSYYDLVVGVKWGTLYVPDVKVTSLARAGDEILGHAYHLALL